MCSECEEPIPAARRREKPDTTLCVGCKTKLEKQPKAKTRKNPEKVKQKKHRLRGRLASAILALPRDKEIACRWTADADSDVADQLAKAEVLVKRFTAALAVKHKFDRAQLVKISAALRQATDKVASIVSKAMNAEANKIRQALKTDARFHEKKAVVSVDSKNRRFLFSNEEKLNLDEVDAMLSESGIE